MTYETAIVGTGPAPDDPGRDGFAMAYRHARGYRRLEECELVACADIVPEHAAAFAEHFSLPESAVYEGAEQLLAEHAPDVCSVCVPPKAHAEVVTTAAETEVLDAIHCEKPVATELRAAREMAACCERHGVQLTFNHQLRYAKPVRTAQQLLEDGVIGELERITFSADNLYDAGTHMFDVCGLLSGQRPAEWVLGQLDYREENVWFGEHNANQAIAQWQYEDGIYGLASVGAGADFLGARLRLEGTDGTIEIGGNGPPLRVGRDGQWTTVDTDGEGLYGPQKTRTGAALATLADTVPGLDSDRVRKPSLTDRAIAAIVDAIGTDLTPELGAENALQATELIFAAWESARRRGRVDLPLSIDDNPLASMVESGELAVR